MGREKRENAGGPPRRFIASACVFLSAMAARLARSSRTRPGRWMGGVELGLGEG